ncbi:MAG: response regulator [Acidobacteria bacterium]|nr:response regulator [Acidobacteriota bacterium]
MFKILIIDDDPFTVRPLEKALHLRGYEVLSESHGRRGFELLKKERPHLLISDMLLPGMHGLELLEHIRRDSELRSMKVVLITGVFKALKYRVESQELGADLFLLKPLNLSTFLPQIDQLLGRGGQDFSGGDEAEVFAELRPEFREHLEKTLLEIQSLIPIAEKNLGTALKDIQMKVHMLAGSAGNFGYPFLTDLARQFDVRLQQILNGEETLAPNELAQISNGLREACQDLVGIVSTDLDDEKVTPSMVPLWVIGSEEVKAALREALVGLSYEVRGFSSLEAADQAVNGERPLVFIELPEDHKEAGKLLEGIPGHRVWACSLKLYFIANEANFFLHLKAVRAQGSGFFLKPLRPNLIIDTLEKGDPFENGKGKVLLIDDDMVLAKQFKKVLDNAGLKTIVLNQPESVLDVLQEMPPDLILLDLYMPLCDGFELTKIIRQSHTYLGVPIIFLSVESGMDRQLEAFRQGVDDYLLKPIKPAHLVSVVKSRISRFREIRTNMVRDSLTGLLNHTSGIERLEAEIARARRNQSDLTVFILDLDFFKNINDTYGHLAGDKVLQCLSFLLQKRLRVSDILARYGGEEFLVVLPETKQTRAYGILDQIREDFAHLVHDQDGEFFHCTFSAGSTTWEQGMTASDVIANADSALYRAKKEGRNRIREA